MRTLGDPGTEPARAEPREVPPRPVPRPDERRPAEPPAGGPGPLAPFLRALLRALSVWST